MDTPDIPSYPPTCEACGGSGTRVVHRGDDRCLTCGGIGKALPKRGDRVKIPKGTMINGTFPESTKVASRTYTVTITRAASGYPGEGERVPGRPAEVTWVGGGNYWHNASIADVEILPPARRPPTPLTSNRIATMATAPKSPAPGSPSRSTPSR